MGRSTVTGSFQTLGSRRDRTAASRGSLQERLPGSQDDSLQQARRRFRTLAQNGFTLLELMIVISIIIILAAVTLPQYQKTIMHTREAVLRDDLYKMRSLIDQFAADKGRLPQSLDDLVSERYMRDVPIDPFTGQKDWAIATGDDPNSLSG